MLVLGPVAALAPVPLFWTEGALPLALAAYEAAVLLLWLKARAGNPVRLSDSILNAIGLSYFLWLALEFVVLKHGLLRSVSHLLLFTAIAKLASLKRPGEARTALLVLFLLTLASASSVTHAASLLYFAAMALLAIRALGRLAVLADFEDAPPDRVLSSVPTGGVAAALIVVSGLIAVPLFYSLPRIRSPFLTAPVRIDDALSTTLSADQVDLETFGAAKRSDRVVLRMNVSPDRAISRALRLREAVFTDYRGGVWTRNPYARGGRFAPRRFPDTTPAAERPGERLAGRVSVDLNPFANGFLFLPYGATGVQLDRGYPIALSDGMSRLPTNRRSVRYSAGLRRVDPRALGSTAIDPAAVPPEIRQYAEKLTGDLTSPVEIARRIRDHFATEFTYTLDPPTGTGDPIANFLVRTKAGHCEFFASAAALMLTARGIPARLVTGSYGGGDRLSLLRRHRPRHEPARLGRGRARRTGFRRLRPHASLRRSRGDVAPLFLARDRKRRPGGGVLLRPPHPRDSTRSTRPSSSRRRGRRSPPRPSGSPAGGASSRTGARSSSRRCSERSPFSPPRDSGAPCGGAGRGCLARRARTCACGLSSAAASARSRPRCRPRKSPASFRKGSPPARRTRRRS